MRAVFRGQKAISLKGIPFNPELTFGSGQVFRWTRLGSSWVGVVKGIVIIANRDEIRALSTTHGTDFDQFVSHYFSFEDDTERILESFPTEDSFLQQAIKTYGPGLRILKQDPWECLISFVCSINSNIPSIMSMIENLSSKFGGPIDCNDRTRFSFPDPPVLANARKSDLMACKVGFRWRYIRFIAQRAVSGELDLNKLRALPYENAHRELLSRLSGNTFGVGPKVADCELLFSYHKMESFPIDVWIFRCLLQNYQGLMESAGIASSSHLSPSTYAKASRAIRERLGRYAGYAQEYMYVKMRQDNAGQRNNKEKE